MFDPAALGTLMIGLEGVRRDGDRPPRAPRPGQPQRIAAVRHRVAAGLRRIARSIDPSPVPAG